MNDEMKNFSGKIGERLDELYKHGGAGPTTKKFGYGGASQQDHLDMMKMPINKADRKINAMASQASGYLK